MKTSIKLSFLMLLLFFSIAHAQQLAFPGAEGYGRFATGGRGGDVYHVTNLNDDGIGSLRYGVENASGPRTIVFDISGTIYLADRLRVENPNITIAGQTAPGDGITLAGDAFYVYESNIIVRYIRCRFGDTSGKEDDAVSIVNGSNIIFDHVTASWSVDETFSCQSSTVDSLTVQWCLVSESLCNSIHSKGAHGYGGIIGATRQSFHHNLYAHHTSRSPKVTGRRHCEVDFRNNVIYNWGYNNCYDGTASYLNWVNNYYKAGPGTEGVKSDRIFELSDEDIAVGDNNSPEDSQTYETSMYADGNYVDGFPGVTTDNWSGGIDFTNGATELKNRAYSPAFIAPSITQQTALECYPLVLSGAGCSLKRDVIDSRIVNEVTTGTATYGNSGIIDSQTDVGGWPTLNSEVAPTDNDLDGISDDWEIANSLNPNDASDRNIINASGYTMLEMYLNKLTENISLDINESVNDNKFSCYPTLITNKLYINFESNSQSKATISIIDITGNKIILKEITTTLGRNNLSIDLSSLSSGIYICVLNTYNFSNTQKIIKK